MKLMGHMQIDTAKYTLDTPATFRTNHTSCDIEWRMRKNLGMPSTPLQHYLVYFLKYFQCVKITVVHGVSEILLIKTKHFMIDHL